VLGCPAMGGHFTRKRRRSALDRPEALGTVLLRASPADGRREGAAAIPPRAWYEVVGDRIARRTRPMRLEHKILTVRAATAVWAQELTFVAPTIIKRLVSLGFEVESLRFRVGPIEAADREPKPPRVKAMPTARPLPRALSEQIAKVDDPSLRRTIARAATANLAWQVAARGKTVTSARPAARGLRSAGSESAPQDQTPSSLRAADRRKP
jgi:hypothetical protein